MRILLPVLLVLSMIDVNAQSGFTVRVINLNDSINRLSLTDGGSLQETLIDGFLNGKLKSYKVPYKTEPVYGVLPRLARSTSWEDGV